MPNQEERYLNFPIQLLQGFVGKSFKILNDICDYAIYIHCEKLEAGDTLGKLRDSTNYFRILLHDREASYNNGKRLFEKFLNEPTVHVGLSTKIFWDFYKNDDKKTEFDKICLLGFLAFKSIVQNKPYCKTNNKLWLARMDGKLRTPCNNKYSKTIQKYNNEYQTKKIKQELELNWYLTYYAYYTRGFYISFQTPIEELALEVEKKKKSVKLKSLNKRKKEARIKALENLRNETKS